MTVCLYILPRLLKKFRTLYKDVDLRVTSGTSEAILRLVREPPGGPRPAHPAHRGGRTSRCGPVLKEEMVVVTAPRHPLSRERTVEPRSLGRYPLILFEPGSNTRKVLDQFFLEQEIPVNVAMETENVEIIKAMVASGLGRHRHPVRGHRRGHARRAGSAGRACAGGASTARRAGST